MEVAPLTYGIGHSTSFETVTKEFSTMKTFLSIGSGPGSALQRQSGSPPKAIAPS